MEKSSPVAIITGCASGIGLATTKLFLTKGYRVFGIDRADFNHEGALLSAAAAGLEAKAKAKDGEESFRSWKADLLEEGACDAAVKACVEAFGPRIDVLANVAGIMDNFCSADTITDAEWNRVIRVNLTAPTMMMRAVLVHMKEAKSGVIVNVSSKAGMSGAASGVAYTASKHGLIGVTKQVAWRFHEEGIRCNAVLPGAVATNIGNNMTQESMDMAGYMINQPPTAVHMPRGTPDIGPEDVAQAILFLASNEAKMINGACLPVDRAWSVV